MKQLAGRVKMIDAAAAAAAAAASTYLYTWPTSSSLGQT